MWGAFKQQFTVDKQNKTSVIILANYSQVSVSSMACSVKMNGAVLSKLTLK